MRRTFDFKLLFSLFFIFDQISPLFMKYWFFFSSSQRWRFSTESIELLQSEERDEVCAHLYVRFSFPNFWKQFVFTAWFIIQEKKWWKYDFFNKYLLWMIEVTWTAFNWEMEKNDKILSSEHWRKRIDKSNQLSYSVDNLSFTAPVPNGNVHEENRWQS